LVVIDLTVGKWLGAEGNFLNWSLEAKGHSVVLLKVSLLAGDREIPIHEFPELKGQSLKIKAKSKSLIPYGSVEDIKLFLGASKFKDVDEIQVSLSAHPAFKKPKIPSKEKEALLDKGGSGFVLNLGGNHAQVYLLKAVFEYNDVFGRKVELSRKFFLHLITHIKPKL